MVSSLILKYFAGRQAYIKSKLCKTLHYRCRDMLNFDLSEKGQGIVSPTHFTYDFLRKMFLTLYSINWRYFIVRLSLLLEVLHNICIAIVCSEVFDVINFELNLILPIKLFFWIVYKKTDERYIEWEQVTTSDNEWYNEWQRVV